MHILYDFSILPVTRSNIFPYTTLFRSTVTPSWPPRNAAARDHRGAARASRFRRSRSGTRAAEAPRRTRFSAAAARVPDRRSEEHTSELQSHSEIVSRLLLVKKIIHTPP